VAAGVGDTSSPVVSYASIAGKTCSLKLPLVSSKIGSSVLFFFCNYFLLTSFKTIRVPLVTLTSIPIRVASSTSRTAITACFLLLVILPGFSQRKYFEFNNPEALKLNKKRIDLLTSAAWECKQLDVYVRGDKTTYRSHGDLLYKSDGTYTSHRLTGTWKILYNRFLVHTSDGKKTGNQSDPMLGIYSVTHMNDTSMILTKLQSSSGDMARTLTFQKSARKGGTVSGTQVSVPRVESKETPVDTFRKVFEEDEPVSFYVVPQRHSVSVDELDLIDSLALKFVKTNGGDHQGRTTIRSLKPYFRQYVGYVDKAGHHIVYLNALLTYHNNWEKELIRQSPETKTEGFRIFVDLTREECFGLHVFGN
jgi:hypothetical protein